MRIACLNCGRNYPDTGAPFRCPVCGGLFDNFEPFVWRAADSGSNGVWRYIQPPTEAMAIISLGEGNTPLISAGVAGRGVYFKCESSNPTGSFKDRGSALIVAFLASRGVEEAIEDSSGNAGASFAAYAARAGIKAHIYMPSTASGQKRQQIEAYGADVIPVPGSRSDATEAAQKAAGGGAVYASHAYLPHNLQGYATCAYEIVEQLGVAPRTVVVPAGQGGLVLGLGRGFLALQRGGAIRDVPALVAVQTAACAPLFALSELGLTGLDLVTEGVTVAEGARVRTPVRADAVIKMVRASGGHFVSVDESLIMPGRDVLARLGFYVEPTSALVWPALAATLAQFGDPVVAILTGSGYKVRM